MKADFSVSNQGSIFLLRPLSEAAQDWAEAHLPGAAPMFGPAFAVEHRYIAAIVDGIQADGLEVA